MTKPYSEKLHKALSIRLSGDEEKKLHKVCEILDMSPSQLVRWALQVLSQIVLKGAN